MVFDSSIIEPEGEGTRNKRLKKLFSDFSQISLHRNGEFPMQACAQQLDLLIFLFWGMKHSNDHDYVCVHSSLFQSHFSQYLQPMNEVLEGRPIS